MIQGSDNDGWLRQSLTQKLILVNQRLSAFNVQLIILDAFRSIECQRGLWAFYHQQYAQNNPQASASQCQQYAAKFVQDINNFNPLEPNRCPAHMTGASIDATLCHLGSGELLDMGTDFEQQVAQSRTDYFERQLQAGMIDDNDLRLNNRRLMHWAFSQEGILNDPALFWHHDWGNQLWFKTCKALTLAPPTAAWYGFAQLNQ
jgi:D-alanyl-D-alanine dipeptidase